MIGCMHSARACPGYPGQSVQSSGKLEGLSYNMAGCPTTWLLVETLNTLLKPKRQFRSVVMVSWFTRNYCACAPMLYMFRVYFRRLYCREWNWLCVNQHPWQRTWGHSVWRRTAIVHSQHFMWCHAVLQHGCFYSNGNQYSFMQASFCIIVLNSFSMNFSICGSSAWWFTCAHGARDCPGYPGQPAQSDGHVGRQHDVSESAL